MTEPWLPIISPSSGVKYQAIADALGLAIEQGELRGGDRLLPQRELAARLGVDLTTVTRAYDLARQRGLIESRGRAGSFVRRPKSLGPRDLAQIDAGMNIPPELPGGLLARQVSETASALLAEDLAGMLQYQPAGGRAWDRAAGAQLLIQMGLPADEQQIVITAGGQNALHAILSANFSAGDRIACSSHVYPGFKSLADRFGISLVPLPRISSEELEKAMYEAPVAALYVVPTNDNPTTRTLPLSGRQALASLARARGIQIIEDDAYGALARDPIAPIASLAPERCWYVASTSKLISPALRVAFVHAPDIAAALRLAREVHETTIMAPPLNVAIVSDWIRTGTFARLLGAMRAESRRRQDLAQTHLAGLSPFSHPDGYHLWLPLHPAVDLTALDEIARATGLTLLPASRFAVGANDVSALRVSLGGNMDDDDLVRGLRLLHAWVSVSR
jgi:DNA-binding transcriptional MocR family regulator